MKNHLTNLLISASTLFILAACTQAAPGSSTADLPTSGAVAQFTPSLTLTQVLSSATPEPQSAPSLTITPRLSTSGSATPSAPLIISPAYPAPGELPSGENAMVTPFIENAVLIMTKTVPHQPVLRVTGNLPTGCYSLQYKIYALDADWQVRVSLAVVPPPPGINCTQEVTFITQDIPLGNLAAGLYTVFVNGQQVDSLQVP